MKIVTRMVALLGIALVALVLGGAASAQAQDLYRVRMSSPGVSGIVSDCSVEGYVLAVPGNGGGKTLHSNSSELEADGTPGPDLLVDLVTDPPVAWSRTYDVGRGTSGTFNGCYGETFGANGYSGNLWIFFETSKGTPSVRFLWHFDYYVTPGNTSREHFTLTSGKIPFIAWTGENLSSRVSGPFLIEYYQKEGRNLTREPIVNRMLEFDLTIEKVQ
jgi:hypothetical protein